IRRWRSSGGQDGDGRLGAHGRRPEDAAGAAPGSTENAAVCTELLQDLLRRGLTVTDRVLCVIDGGKGVRKAVQDVLGTAAVIQRCQVHKARNLQALLPQARQAYLAAMLRRAGLAAPPRAARPRHASHPTPRA